MKKFQIRNIGSDGCGSFFYTTVDENEDPVEKCCELANEKLEIYLNARYNCGELRSVLLCVEYDNEKKKAKRGGLKFKIERGGFTVGYSDGTKSKYVTSYKLKQIIKQPTDTKQPEQE